MSRGWVDEGVVGAGRFELPTSASRTRRANQAALRPDSDIIRIIGSGCKP